MSPDQQKIQALIDSGIPENIELAFSLMESLGIVVDLPTKSQVADWLRYTTAAHEYDALAFGLDILVDDTPLSLEKSKNAIYLMMDRFYMFIDLDQTERMPSFLKWMKQLKDIRFCTDSARFNFDIGLQLSHLNSVDFQGNIVFKDAAIASLAQAKKVHIDSNKWLKKFPLDGQKWENLEELVIRDCTLKSINLDLLPALKTLTIESRAGVKEWPIKATKALALKALTFNNEQVEQLSQDIWALLPELSYLAIETPLVAQMPDELAALKALKTLSLCHNKLSKVPDFISRFTNLETLYLSYNELQELPDFIGNLKQLKIIHLQSNQLKSLPDSFANLKKLEHMEAGENKLEALPDYFTQFNKLKSLYIEENNLKTLPKDFAQMQSLKNLVISAKEQQVPEIQVVLQTLPKHVEVADQQDLPF